MKISTEIHSIQKHIGYEKAIEYVAKAGFDAFDFSMFEMARFDWKKNELAKSTSPLSGNQYLSYVKNLRKIADDNGIICNQSHAPFPTRCKEIRDFYDRALECTAIMGGEICIIHPDNNKSPKENAELYFELLKVAKGYGVKIATENMWNWDDEKDHAVPAACSSPKNFLRHIESVNDEDLVACLDIGHAEMKGVDTSAVEMIKTLGGHLQALHIHDNDLWHDSHQIPGSMNIDFETIVKALKEIDYKGYFTLEADCYLEAFNKDNVFEGIKNLKDSATSLAEMFEAL